MFCLSCTLVSMVSNNFQNWSGSGKCSSLGFTQAALHLLLDHQFDIPARLRMPRNVPRVLLNIARLLAVQISPPYLHFAALIAFSFMWSRSGQLFKSF